MKPTMKKITKRSPKKGRVTKAKMSDRKQKKSVALWPIEVTVDDCVLHEQVIAEYRHEWKWWFGTKLFKVYHPAFTETEGNYRWVMALGKVLGPIPPDEKRDTNTMLPTNIEVVANG